MPVVTASNLRHAFGERVILDGCAFGVEPGERVGVVGRNGAGKSTLLKALAGLLKPDSGTIDVQRSARIGYLQQDPEFDPEDTLRDAAEAAFAELHRLHAELNDVFDKMAEPDADIDALLRRQERLERAVEAAGGYAVDHRIDAVLHGLGFTDAQFAVKTSGLSGGQRARLALARLLLEEPDVLLLDEPTNHLDLAGRLWLESFLRDDYAGAVVMISHDRYLLNHVVTRIVEVEQGRAIDYPGNYAAFRRLRAERRAAQLRAFENQQTKWKQEEAFIRRYKAGQRAKQARGRESKLRRDQRDSSLEKPAEMASFRLDLPKPPRAGDMVASARGLSKAYPTDTGGEKILFRGLDLTINRGERWGIIGPNGAGKSTLVRCLLGEQDADSGDVRLGSSLAVGHFKQSEAGIDPDLPVVRYLQKAILKETPDRPMSEQQTRDLAGAFLFSGNDQDKPMGVLSGGERSRARLAALLASAKNVLVLDEPTNHFDIEASERLEDALALPVEATSEQPGRPGGAWDGTLLLISHDRAIIDACCDRLLVFDGAGDVQIVLGNYSRWHEQETARDAERQRAEADARRAEQAKQAELAKKKARDRPAAKKPGPGPSNGELERLATDDLEARIERIESRIREIDGSLAEPDVWSDPRKCQKLGDERTKLVRDLEPLEFEWTRRADASA